MGEGSMGRVSKTKLEKKTKNIEELRLELKTLLEILPRTDQQKDVDEETYEYLLDKSPQVVEDILNATRDAKEVLINLIERATKTLQRVGVPLEFTQIYEINNITQKESMPKTGVTPSPEVINTPDEASVDMLPARYSGKDYDWGGLKLSLSLADRFSGLDKRQIEIAVEAEGNRNDAYRIGKELASDLRVLSLNRKRQLESKDNINQIEHAVNEISYKNKFNRTAWYGLIQKLRFAPMFVADKFMDKIDASLDAQVDEIFTEVKIKMREHLKQQKEQEKSN